MRTPSAARKLKLSPGYLALAAATCMPLAVTPSFAADLLVGNGGNGGVSSSGGGSGGGGGIGGGGGGGKAGFSGGAGGGLARGGDGILGINSPGGSSGGAGGSSGTAGGQAGVGGGGGAGGPTGSAGGGGSGGGALGAGGGIGNGGAGGDGGSIVDLLGTPFAGTAGQGAQAAGLVSTNISASYDYVGIGGGGGGGGFGGAAGGDGQVGSLSISNATWTVNRSLLVGGAGGGSSATSSGGRGGDGVLTLMGVALTVADTFLIGGSGGGASASQAGGLGGNGTVTVGDNSTLLFGNGARLVFGGGTGGGTGVLNLGQGIANFAGGGAFTINANGTLNIGNDTPGTTTGGTIANLTTLVNNGTINFNQAGSYALNSGITGSGSVAVKSSGTTALVGNNTYTGGTTVSGSTLQIGQGGTTGSIVGDIVMADRDLLSASVVFNRSDTVDYAGNISGTGSLINAGTGLLRLSGVSTATGEIIVSNGGMELTGDAARLGSATSDVYIGAGAATQLTVSNGAQLTSHDVQVGSSSYTGNATVKGPDSTWSANFLVIGGAQGANGSLQVMNGAQVSAVKSFLGYVDVGTALVSGANSRWDSQFGVILGSGSGGMGSVVVDGGATLSAQQIEIAGIGGSAEINGSDATGRGVLQTAYVERHAGTPISTVDFNGGVLRATASEANLFRGFAPGDITLGAGGIYLDSNGFDVGTSTVLDGSGRLNKTGAGTLTLSGANTYTGGTSIQGGTLSVSADVSLGAAVGDLEMSGGTLATTASFDTSRNVSLAQDSTFNVADGTQLGLTGAISGTGAFVKSGLGAVTLSGTNSYASTQVLAGTLIGNSASIAGNLLNNGSVIFDQGVDGSTAGSMSGTGSITKRGAGVLTLAGTNTLSWNIEQGTLASEASRYSANAMIGAAGTLRFAQAANGSYAGKLSGSGVFEKTGAGTLTLSADSSAYTGTTRVQSGMLTVANQLGGNANVVGGRLHVTGALSGNAAIGNTAILSGTGTIGQNVTLTGGTLQGAQGGTLKIGGDLTLNNASQVNVALGNAPSNALFDVQGNLALAGTLNVTDDGGFGPGVYRLFDYGGTLTSNTLAIGAAPTGVTADDLRIQTAVSGQVNLMSTAGATLSFWDGSNAAQRDNGVIDGGAGAWRTDGLNWTDEDGILNGRFQPNPTFAVFQGQAGTVSVDDTAGAVGVTGMQIASTGYRIEGDSIALAGGAETVVRVGSGDVSGAAITGTIASNLTGASKLVKADYGTLVLTGANTYTGGTEVRTGTLVGNEASIRGNLLNNGAVVFNQATDATYAGDVSGTGTMAKQGVGTLTLTGLNAQDWRVDAGTLAVSAGRYSSNTNIASGAQARFDQTGSASFSGMLAGAGQVTKTGAGTLQLLADSSSFSGQTQVQAGTLQVTNALGGSVSVTGGRLANNGVLGGNVTVSGAGILSGSGRVNGNATLAGGVLEGVQGQTLAVGGDLSLSNTSQVNVALGLAPNSALFDVGGNLTLAGTLNVTDQGGFGAGVYRLFDYGGSLVNNGLTVGATPFGVDASALTLQTAVGGQVNLASTSGALLGYWDGGNATRHDNGAIDGGAGTWRADGRNWANVNGTLNGAFQPNPTYAVFQAQAGTVTVDASAGAIGVTGMQIATDGYRIEGDAIALQGLGGESIIRVGSGSSADAGMTGTIAASLTGTSKLAKSDFGRLVLTGDNTYTGGTDVRVGTLSVSKDANLGAATGGLTLSGGVLATTASFNTNRAITLTQASGIDVSSGTTLGLSGAISGSGDLTKAGAGVLTVSGDGSGYTGSMLVQAGALNMASSGKLGGTLTLASGTLLQGSGQVGTTTLQSGAMLAPGKVNGTLNVAGNLTFMPGAVYQVAADPASSDSARVAVSGVANLAGSVVHVGPEGGFETTRQYTILSANAINGQFDNVSSNYAFLAPALRYGAQDVTLQLGRKVVPAEPGTPSRPIAFADAARTGNQRAVANALDSLPSDNALHQYILTLPEGAPPAAFNSLSGEAHASVASSLMGSSSTTRTLPLSHLRANLNAGMRPGAPTAQAGGMMSASALPSSNAQPAWAELVGNWQTQNATDNTAQVRQHTGGVFVGADHAVGNGWRVGGAVGYTDSKIRVDDRSSNADVSGYSAAIYGGKSFDAGAGKLNLLVGTSYTWHDVSTERYATVAGASQKLTADYGASTTQLFTELGYAMPLSDRTTLEPFVGLAWSDLRSRSFSESGGSAALNGQSSSDKQTSSTLGMRAQTDFTLSGAEGRLQATLGWRHAFGDVLPQSTMAFDGGQAFTVSGAPIARNAAVAELGAEVAVSKNASVGLNYSGQYGGGNREHAGSLNVRWRY
ncbi:autotransporter domain-containing protein [Achromobacter sp. JUb104]|uniref:autotransporter domain-containing protein n=1 Tax=Achromobacter sp. JUb104 TaxID=2940590 RepID=UPI00286DB25A|nr:autotransporter domain-containing protein [Achromobacter sp. JUb104]MCS3506239.1 fibronectin-binding autotransporter adhesin [Achromobacter sp. JUb104]